MELVSIQLTPIQAEFLQWANFHYHQLLQLQKSGCLDKPGSNFTVHLKDTMVTDVPPVIDHIDLAGKFYPQ